MRVRDRMSHYPGLPALDMARQEDGRSDVVAAGAETAAGLRVLIGGVGYRWLRDASFGLLVGDELASQSWPPGIEVADLGYGALYVAQDLAAASPPYERLILIAGTERGRTPGTVYRYRWTAQPVEPEEIQARIREAGAGVIDLDHLLIIAHYFGALPASVSVIEFEPVEAWSGDGLSPAAAARLSDVLALVRAEALAPRTRESTADDAL